jgi:hypothetical protein
VREGEERITFFQKVSSPLPLLLLTYKPEAEFAVKATVPYVVVFCAEIDVFYVTLK